MSDNSKRGLASADEETRERVASEGGKAAHAKDSFHEFNSAEAREAGKKGGRAARASQGVDIVEEVEEVESDVLVNDLED